ncbi:hypothetical protein AVEN_74276-1 [Araneus ventricosus]|uniref:Sperm microtubule inner protein 1 C-terminal domain-containing protein n=1 Tax=Araneus ventricosus TaxID=182803 RepID=A0A4Y2NW27_ARAVE|nr:hypothetical protein AVEN_74276-1 [Araneus ventricosus]
MAREKTLDPAFQKAFTEAINKENKVRIKWHLEHGARLKSAAPDACRFDDEPDDDDEDFVPPGPDTSTETERPEKEPCLSWKEQESPKEEDPGKVRKIEDLKKMKPVPTDTKKILYKGVSHEGEGRKKYLKDRYQEDPEDKYFFPVCSSWDYGWTFGQDHELRSPEYGNVQITRTSFFRPNDPQLKPRDQID